MAGDLERKAVHRPGWALPLLIALLAACGGASEKPRETPPSKPASPVVTMELIQFKPSAITVSAGDEITWTQKDAGVHTVISGVVEQGAAGVTMKPDGKFDSGEIATGQTFSFTFDEPGTYPYFCSIHAATMRGEVRVS